MTKPFPQLATARLLLRQLAEADLPRLALLANNQEVARNTLKACGYKPASTGLKRATG